jgi:beta-phosphoglucomutase-like phosphatase (HAD superfamily)
LLPPEALAAERGRQKAQVVRRLVEKSGGRAGVSGSHPGEVDATAARVYAAFPHELERRVPSFSEIPGTSDTLRQLQARGIRVALESGFSSGVVRALVRRLGWEKAGLVNYVIPDEMGVGIYRICSAPLVLYGKRRSVRHEQIRKVDRASATLTC